MKTEYRLVEMPEKVDSSLFNGSWIDLKLRELDNPAGPIIEVKARITGVNNTHQPDMMIQIRGEIRALIYGLIKFTGSYIPNTAAFQTESSIITLTIPDAPSA